MAQIIKNRRGSLDRLSSATGSLQKGEILIATGSSKLTGVTNGQGLVFAAVESGSVVAANRVLQGAVAPIFSASIYGTLLDGVPFYASSSNTLFLLGADGNTTPDLTGNIGTFSSSVATSFSASAASIASVTGDFSSSVATSFSASNASVTALSASTYHAVFGFGELSSSIEESISASVAKAANDNTDLSASIATRITNLSSSIATTDSASAYQISELSASVASVGGTFSSSVATDFSASNASQNALSGAVATTITNLSSSIATTDSASAAYAASQLSSVSSSVATNFSASAANVTSISGAFATSTSASNAEIAALSASVASVGGTFSSSVATDFSASTAARVALSASIAVTDNAQSDRLDVIENTFATTGSNTFNDDQIISGSLWVTGDVTIFGSSSLINVTASAVSIGTNTIVLNTANPAVRFGGIQVIDSGSSQSTGSLYWDSTNNVWLYANPVGAGYGSARLIAGPQNTGSLGEEIGLTTTYVPVALGDDHIGDSVIKVIGNEVTVESGSLYVELELSASTINGIGNVSEFSSSISASIASINNNLGAGGSLGNRVAGLEALTGSYATTGSNTFVGEQIISSSLIVTNEIKGTGSIFLQPDVNDSRKLEIYNTGATDIHIKATGGETFLGDDTNYVKIDDSAATITIESTNGVYIKGITETIGDFSQSVDSRLSSSLYTIGELSASVASVGGTFSSSVATDFSASNAARVALSASLSERIAANDALDATYATTGSNVFHGDQTITGSLDTTGTVNFNNAVAVNDSNMNLGNSSSLNLTGGSSIYVGGAGTISGSIVGIGNVSLYSTSVDSRFSASAYEVSQLSASVASVGGTFSSSVATDFSASNAAREALSQSVYDTLYWPTTGLSASFASSSLYNTAILSASVYDAIFSPTSTALSYSFASSSAFNSSSVSSSISELSSSVSQSIYETIFSSTNPFSLSSSFASASAAYSSSAATFVSESFYQNIYFPSTGLSASFSSSLGILSGSVSTSFSASAASITELSASVTSISGAFATSTSASNAEIAALSASVASVGGTFSSSVATDFSASNAARVELSSSIDTRLKGIEFLDTTYATTGSNSFTGSQGILGDVTISGSLYVQFGQDVVANHISGNQGRIELGNIDSNVNIIADNELRLTATGSGVHVHSTNFSVSPNGINNNVLVVSESITRVTNEFSASNISGVGNIAEFSQSVDSRLDAVESYSSSLNAAIELTGSSVTIKGDLYVRGTTTTIDSTTVSIGDNIIVLNGTNTANGGIYVKDPTFLNPTTGSFVWDSANDYWIAGRYSSESKVLVAVGDNVFTSSIQTALSGTFGYSDFSSSVATSFSASAASIASVTGDFSSSVATSFSASAASVIALSSSIATDFSASAANISSISGAFATSTSASNYEITQLSASVASVGGTFSSSVATDFSASAFVVSALSASIYLTDATQSTDITNNSSSFATSVSASNFRITILETTIDGGSF